MLQDCADDVNVQRFDPVLAEVRVEVPSVLKGLDVAFLFEAPCVVYYWYSGTALDFLEWSLHAYSTASRPFLDQSTLHYRDCCHERRRPSNLAVSLREYTQILLTCLVWDPAFSSCLSLSLPFLQPSNSSSPFYYRASTLLF